GLGDGEPLALTGDDVLGRNPDVVEDHLGVATVVPAGVAEDVHAALDVHTGGVHRDQDLALLAVPLRVRIGLAHDDQDLAARAHRSRGDLLAPVDDVVVAVAVGPGADVGRVRRGLVRLGHAERGADLPFQQWFEPLLLLLFGAEHGQDFHVPG